MFKRNKLDLLFIAIIVIFSSIIVYFLINANNNLGIYCSDVFIYLTNSLQFAGYQIGKPSTLYLSPVICFLTSLIFRAGFINQIAIFAVTGIFFPIAIIGVYVLLRLKLSELISFFGAILFSSFSLMILWAANGSLDIPAIAFSIWAIYFTILAVDKNPKYYLLAFPIFVLGFFTRYTVGFILPLIALYILFNLDIFNHIKTRLNLFTNKKLIFKRFKDLINSKNFKYFVIGIIIALILFSTVLIVISRMGSDLTFITQTQDVVAGNKGSSIDPGFKPDPYFYLTHFPNFLSSENIEFDGVIPVLNNPSILSYFTVVLILMGGLFYILDNIKKKHEKNKEDNKKDKKQNEKNRNIKIILVIILSTIIILTYRGVSSIISEILFLINILLIFNILNNNNKNNTNKNNENNDVNNYNNKNDDNDDNNDNKIDEINTGEKSLKKIESCDNTHITDNFHSPHTKTLNLHLLMISWFFIYLIFFSFSDIKVDRYFITVLPVIAYFAAYSLDFLIKLVNRKNHINKNTKNTKNERNERNEKNEKNNKILQTIVPLVLIIIFATSAFANIGTIPSENKISNAPLIVSEWLMNYDPSYDTQVIWTYNVRYYNWYLNMNSVGAYEKDILKLEKNNVSYYISKNISQENYTIKNYTIIKKFDDINIYKRNT